MRTPRFLSLALLAAIPATVAWVALPTMKMQPDSKLWIDGTSTVRGFSCKATVIDAVVETEAAGAAAAVIAGTKAVKGVTVTIPAKKLDCNNGTMNGHMYKALTADQNPTIEFKVATYDLAKTADGVKGTLTGTLKLGATERPISVAAQGKKDGDGLRVTGVHELNMKEFGLKPPTLMMGTMKVNEKVKVGFDLLLKD